MPANARSPAALAAALAAAVVFTAAIILTLRGRHSAAPRPVAVYLAPGATEDDILRVYTSVLGRANANGRGFTLHYGIAGVSLAGDEGQTVLLLHLREDLAAAARDSLLAALRASPLVSRVEPAGRM